VLLDDIVDTALCSLALGSLLYLLLSLLLALACSFAVGGGETCTRAGSLSLTWW
jgi:hypothetical protein